MQRTTVEHPQKEKKQGTKIGKILTLLVINFVLRRLGLETSYFVEVYYGNRRLGFVLWQNNCDGLNFSKC